MPSGPSDPPDWDERITLQEAAAICGLQPAYLRQRALAGDLRTERMGARLRVTTRRWLDDYLRARGTKSPGRAPKPLPPDYQAPPRRGRPPGTRRPSAPSPGAQSTPHQTGDE